MLKKEINKEIYNFSKKLITLKFSTLPSKFTSTSKLKIFYGSSQFTLADWKLHIKNCAQKNEGNNYLTFTLILVHLIIFLYHSDITLTRGSHSSLIVWILRTKPRTNLDLPSRKYKKYKKMKKWLVWFDLEVSICRINHF